MTGPITTGTAGTAGLAGPTGSAGVADRAATTDPADPALDAAARRIVAFARDEAAAQGRARWGTGHLLLGLVRGGGAVGDLLHAAGLSTGAVLRGLVRDEAAAVAGVGDDTVSASARPCGPAAEAVLEVARKTARATGRSAVGSTDLLVAVLHAPSGTAAGGVLGALEVPGDELADAARTLAARPAPDAVPMRWRDPTRLLSRRGL